MSSLNIKDTQTRNSMQKVERRLQKIDNIKQLPINATLEDVIIAINKITDSLKR